MTHSLVYAAAPTAERVSEEGRGISLSFSLSLSLSLSLSVRLSFFSVSLPRRLAITYEAAESFCAPGAIVLDRVYVPGSFIVPGEFFRKRKARKKTATQRDGLQDDQGPQR